MRTRKTHKISAINYYTFIDRSASLPGSPLPRHGCAMYLFDHCIHNGSLALWGGTVLGRSISFMEV
jgi:hypothetical protein